ncbi:MAG: chemotaxis response regulator protein-glutamate methylesterase [Alphaproteobacteria bacterium]|nr:chemotaxis response regulator protein-glutamate methylesterase [Alphaproteobacteria bacterium]
MLVDDSAVVRGLISRALESEPQIEVVSSVQNGEMAVNAIARIKPDIVILDIEMPVMDGITALPKLLKSYPPAKVIMCSTLTEKGAAVSMKAMALGATEYICKPSSTREAGSGSNFQADLIRLVRSIGGVTGTSHAIRSDKTAPPRAPAERVSAPPPAIRDSASIRLLDDPRAWSGKPTCIAIGSSTGGPKALFDVIAHFKGFDVPIALTQHMPPTFTKILAQHIEGQTGVPAIEAENGTPFIAGRVHVAPGGFHMEFEQKGSGTVIRLNDGPPENYCKPSVDPMFRSLIKLYGRKILGVILTGMGHDGLEGSRLLIAEGGRLVAQDEATSVVWGMPGAVASAGLCTAVLPLDKIGPWVRNKVLSG